MAYIIIGFILLLVIVPVFAILPSKKQKGQMTKRKTAMARGIGVELTRIDDPDPDPEKYLSSTGKQLERKMSVAAYRLQRKRIDSWRPISYPVWGSYRKTVQKEGGPAIGWQWDEDLKLDGYDDLKHFIVANLSGLPNDVVRVEEKNLTVSIYWKEEGDVQEAIDFLEGCTATDITIADADESSDDENLTGGS